MVAQVIERVMASARLGIPPKCLQYRGVHRQLIGSANSHAMTPSSIERCVSNPGLPEPIWPIPSRLD